MKKILFLTSMAALILFLCACQSKVTEMPENLAESFADLEANFANPHVTFRPAPLWVWNGTVTKEFIDASLSDLKAHGFGGVVVHSRYGMTNDYLSEEWFELYQYAVEKVKELGMESWIYDENWCPSGFAGGHVPATMPESCNQAVSLREVPLARLNKEDFNNYVAIFELTGNGYINITEKASEYIGKTGAFLAYEKLYFETGLPGYAGFSYVDLLIPGVTEHFIKVTIEEGCKTVVGDEFGKTIIGSFTDEPHIAPVERGSFRWTPDLFDRFRERYRYNLEDNLPSIKNNTGDYKRVRHNYYQILLQLFIDRWAKPSYEYYTANNLEFAGHYWEHCWPSPYHGGDDMAMAAWHHRPTIDLLFNQMDEELPVQFGDVRNVKEVSSVANQMGRRRTLSETYGASGWDLTFDDMKRLGDWEYVLGINTMTQHLIFQTFLGCRKHDFPQSFSYHAPYWDQYTRMNDYFGRLSYALSAGQQINDIVIFEPTTTAWMYYQSEGEKEKENNPALDKINRSFRELLNGLEAKQIEYDLASENIVKEQGSVNEKLFIIGQRAYKTIILPEYMETLDRPTANLLSQFLKNGGEVIIVGEAPFTVSIEELKELKNSNKSENKISEAVAAKEHQELQAQIEAYDEWKRMSEAAVAGLEKSRAHWEQMNADMRKINPFHRKTPYPFGAALDARKRLFPNKIHPGVLKKLKGGREHYNEEMLQQLTERQLKEGKAPLSLIDGVVTNYGKEWEWATLLNNNATVINHLQNNAIKFNTLNPGDGRFYHMRRELTDGQLLFFINSSKEDEAGASLTMKGKSVLLMDLMAGTIKGHPFTQQDEEVNFEFQLEPSGSILFFISEKELEGFDPLTVKTGSEVIEAEGGLQVNATAPNVLAIDYLTLTLDGETFANQNTTDATAILFKARGSEMGTPWFNAVHYKLTFADLNKPYEAQPGFKAEYKFVIADDFDYSGIKATLEQAYPATVSINGSVVSPIRGEYYIDRDFSTFAIGQYLKKGENTLAIAAPQMHILAELEPAFITGNFTVQPAAKGFTLNAPVALQLGSWKQQGYPFYWEAVSYTTTYNITDANAGYTVKLNEWRGTVAEISVNGEVAGIIGWRPYTLDVSNRMKEGMNSVTVKVIGSLYNVIGPFNTPPNGIATPWSWRYQPPFRPGAEYYHIDYGLFSPFLLCKY